MTCFAGRSLASCVIALSIAMAAAPAGARIDATTLIIPPEKHTLGIYRATNFHLKLFTGPKSRFQNPQGLACVKLASLDDPARIGDDDELTVYGVNADEPSIIYNDSMTSVKIWRGPMRAPRGIAADALGRVVVADTGNDRLLFLENDRGKLQLKATAGASGAGPREFREPTGVALDSRGRVYVADTGNNRIQILDRAGQFVSEFGRASGGVAGAPTLLAPTAIAVVDRDERWSQRKTDRVVVADRGGRRLQVFTPAGELLHAFADTTRDGLSFAYVALDYHDNVYATDTRRSQIHKFDSSLNWVASFGQRGDGDGEFDAPTGIAIWRRLGQFFIAEATGAQYYWLGTDLRDVRAQPLVLASGAEQSLSYTLTERSIVDIDLLDRDDRVVRSIAHQAYQEIGAQRTRWDCRSDGGVDLAPGAYRVRIGAVATYSSRKHFRCERVVPFEVRAVERGS